MANEPKTRIIPHSGSRTVSKTVPPGGGHLSGLIAHQSLLTHRLAARERAIEEHMEKIEHALKVNAEAQEHCRHDGDPEELSRLLADEKRLTAAYQRLAEVVGRIHIAPVKEE